VVIPRVCSGCPKRALCPAKTTSARSASSKPPSKQSPLDCGDDGYGELLEAVVHVEVAVERCPQFPRRHASPCGEVSAEAEVGAFRAKEHGAGLAAPNVGNRLAELVDQLRGQAVLRRMGEADLGDRGLVLLAEQV
jgi:hypothetical protein